MVSLSGSPSLEHCRITGAATFTLRCPANDEVVAIRKALQENNSWVAQPAIESFGRKIELLSGKRMDELKALYTAYQVGYIIYHYFDAVEEPEEGDLVVYNGGVHLAVCKSNTPQGLTVVSCWKIWKKYMGYTVEHDPFFLGHYEGYFAQVYRLKRALSDTLLPQIPAPSEMATMREDGTYVFEAQNKEYDDLRMRIWRNRQDRHIEFPQLQQLSHIDFIGNCYAYALGKVLKTYSLPKDIPDFCEEPEQTLTFFNKYFEFTSTPQNNDLVFYYYKDPSTHPHLLPIHYGIVTGNRVESKWGHSGSVWIHPPFYVLPEYGNFIRYARLRGTL